jgi:predicted regulator of Ras-like GTPase activity (Roadblock/LC7/MglB family)
MSAAAEKALAELTEISSQVEAAALFDRKSGFSISSLSDEEQGKQLVSTAKALLEAAEEVRGDGEPPLTQLEVATGEGSAFVVRDGERVAAAVTAPEPTTGLVFYDLKSCLRSAFAKPARRRASTKAQSGA